VSVTKPPFPARLSQKRAAQRSQRAAARDARTVGAYAETPCASSPSAFTQPFFSRRGSEPATCVVFGFGHGTRSSALAANAT
jgi:hypothetical protein